MQKKYILFCYPSKGCNDWYFTVELRATTMEEAWQEINTEAVKKAILEGGAAWTSTDMYLEIKEVVHITLKLKHLR